MRQDEKPAQSAAGAESAQCFQATHIRAQHLRDSDAAIGVLVVFQYRDQRTTHSQPEPFSVCTSSGLPVCGLRQRAIMRRAWKSSMLEQEEISRYFC